MIEKVTRYIYKNNVDKINEIIDYLNNLNIETIDTSSFATKEELNDYAAKTDLNNYVLASAIGNENNKIPVFNAEGHLVFPDGTEIY